MTHHERLQALLAELKRQDALLAESREALLALGDVELAVPAELLEEPDAHSRIPVAVVPSAVRA